MLHRGRRPSRPWEETEHPPIVSDESAACEIILRREKQQEMTRAINGLSHKLREVVVLRYGAGQEYAEIAETLSLPLGTVKRRLFDALNQLRKRLRED